MRYNSYRQYVTLNGVKRENKMDVIKNLKPYNKNVMRYIPKTEYEKLIFGHTNITLRLVVNVDNTIRSIKLLVSDTVGGSLQVVNEIEIPLIGVCYYNGVFDGNVSAPDLVKTRYYTSSNQQMTVNYTPIGTTGNAPTQQIISSDISRICDGSFRFYQVFFASGLNNYAVYTDKTLSYIITDIDVTSFSYDNLPTVPITYFE